MDPAAHTPASGDQSFSETVSDLSPGHLWFVTVCGGDAAMHPDLCNHSYATYPWEPEHFFTTPSRGQDYVLGSHRPAGGTPPWLIVSITTAAASGPQGQAPDGYLTWRTKGGEMFFGRVTCLLVVDGSRAAIGAVGQDRYFGRGPTPRPCWRPSRMAWSRGSTSSPG